MPQINAPISEDTDRRIRAFTTRYQRAAGSDSEHRAAFVRAAIKHFLDSPELRLHGLQKRLSRLEISTSERLEALEAAVKALRATGGVKQKA
jgi:DNA-binding TFAR19-related protein (PDSD5 family)